MKKITVIVLAFLVISCHTSNDMAISMDTKVKEVQKIMNNRQPFSNSQLNSLLSYDLSAKGLLVWKLEYNQNNITGNAISLILLDDARAILDYSSVFFAINTFNQKVLGYRNKSENAFIILGEGQDFYSFQGYRLEKLRFDDFQASLEKRYFVPGLSEYSRLALFIPKSDTFIAGVQGTGDPKYHTPIFALREKQYKVSSSMWYLAYNGFAAMPPVSIDGNVVVAMNNLIRIIGIDGNIKKEIEGKFAPFCSSIGVDNIIYLFCKTELDYVIRAMDFDGNIKWECPTSITKPNQPPIVSNESIVYIIGSSKVEAFANGEKLWDFELIGNSRQLASVSRDGMLLVSDGNRVICLSKTGELSWKIQSGSGETFMTQPVLDSVGKVFVATDKSIVVLQ